MIVPDKKTEAYLNEPVSPKGVLRLCRTGVLSSFDFLRAAALCRSDKKWSKFIALILRFLTALSFVSAIFFFVVSQWGFFYQTGGMVVVSLLFVLCVWLRHRSNVFNYVGTAVIGFMIFLPDIVFNTNGFLYERFFLWFALSALWAFGEKNQGLYWLCFFILNGAVFLYGFEFAVPSFVFTPTEFCVFAAFFNFFCLLLSEYVRLKKIKVSTSGFPFFCLLWAFVFLLCACVVQCFPLKALNIADGCFLLCATASIVCGYLYGARQTDKAVRRLVLVFSVIWITCLLYRLIYLFVSLQDLKQALFFSTVSCLIGGALIWERLSVFRLKGNEYVG